MGGASEGLRFVGRTILVCGTFGKPHSGYRKQVAVYLWGCGSGNRQVQAVLGFAFDSIGN